MNISKGIQLIFGANIVNLFLNVIITFLMPKYLAVDRYSLIKTYQLYVSYCGILHLGFVDAVYLRYSGNNINDVNNEEVQKNIALFKSFQWIMTIFFIGIGVYMKDIVVVALALTIYPVNLISFFQYFYQAIGDYKNYSRILKFLSTVYFIGVIILLFILKSTSAYIYIYWFLGVRIIAIILLQYGHRVKKVCYSRIYFSIKELVGFIKIGCPLMLGNLISELLISLDRWFIKFFFNTVVFAQYSFAANIESFINAVISPITITLYNYLVRVREWDKVYYIRKLLWIVSSYVLLGVFPIKFLIYLILPNYKDSCTVIILLFASQFFFIIYKGVYVNLYKVHNLQNMYFSRTLVIVIISAVLNYVFIKIFNSSNSVAMATLCSSIICLIISRRDFKEIRIKTREVLYILGILSIYLLCSLRMSVLSGTFVYVLISTLMNILFFNRETKKIMKYVGELIKDLNR